MLESDYYTSDGTAPAMTDGSSFFGNLLGFAQGVAGVVKTVAGGENQNNQAAQIAQANANKATTNKTIYLVLAAVALAIAGLFFVFKSKKKG